MEILKAPEKKLCLEENTQRSAQVAAIIEKIRSRGWEEVKSCSLRFDNHEGPFRVPSSALAEAKTNLPENLRKSLERAISNVRAFHRLQRDICTDRTWETAPGIFCGIRFVPVESAGVYVPGGRYPLPSTAIMGVVPAQEAGVSRVAVFSPPQKNGGMDPVILGTLALLGVEEVWSLGGVQAIAAGALGVDPVEKVDMFVGPGNAWVTEAKRLLFGTIGIDGLAGPSEVLVVADAAGDPEIIAADLMAQSEHDPLAKSTLITLDPALGRAVEKEVEKLLARLSTKDVAAEAWKNQGSILWGTLEEAIDFANQTAPEHLELAVEDPESILPRFRAYGAAFLGHRSGEAFGDYVAGTNHVLPTGQSARFSGGLWTGSFLRPLTSLRIEDTALQPLCDAGEEMAQAEGLMAHKTAFTARRKLI